MLAGRWAARLEIFENAQLQVRDLHTSYQVVKQQPCFNESVLAGMSARSELIGGAPTAANTQLQRHEDIQNHIFD